MSDRDDLPELDASELAMLAAFQAEEQPSAAALDRVRARVLDSTAVAPTGSVIRGPWAPWAVVGVVAAAAAALLAVNLSGADATAVSQRDADQAADVIEMAEGGRAIAKERPEPAPRQARPTTKPVPPAAAPEPAGPIVEPIATPPVAEPKPSPPRRPAKKRPAAAPHPEPEPAKPESSLAAETRLLDQARRAVAGGRPNAALTILRDAQSKFPNGVLRQERAALRVVALCDAGKHEAGRKAAAAFSKAHPGSALRSRVDAACPSE